MFKHVAIVCTFLFTAVWNVNAYEERAVLEKTATREQIKEALVMNQQWNPFPKQYTDRAAWDAFLGENKEILIKTGERYLGYEWKVIKNSYYLAYERTGDRNIMQSPYSANNRALAALVAGELAEGKGRFMDDIIDGVVHSCEMTSWALSAHLYSLSKLGRSIPYENEFVLELTQGELSQLLSWTYYYLHGEMDKVSPTIAKRLRNELQKRELDPYMQRSDFWWMGFDHPENRVINNWNPWCNDNAIICFMLLENDKDKLADAVYRTMLSVDKYINWVTADGACEEGPSYWGHAHGKLYDYLVKLNWITGGKVNLFDMPLVKNMGEYIVRSDVGKGWVVNFADAEAKGGGDPSMTFRFGKAVGSELMMRYAAARNQVRPYRPSPGTDVFRLLEGLRYCTELKNYDTNVVVPAYSWYPATEFCYLTNTNGFFVAMKGGHNNESHNHNDVGTCTVYLNSTPLLIDAGTGTYTAKTFSAQRYELWMMQSQYHNLPSINGVMQHQGRNYRSANVKADTKKQVFSLDIAGAYPAEAKVKSWNRSYRLGKQALVIQDKFALTETVAPNTVNFMTWGKVDASKPGVIYLEVNGEKASLTYDKNQFKASVETIALPDVRLSKIWGKEIYRIVLTVQKQTMTGTYTYTFTKI